LKLVVFGQIQAFQSKVVPHCILTIATDTILHIAVRVVVAGHHLLVGVHRRPLLLVQGQNA
jgi:hypothetical protein